MLDYGILPIIIARMLGHSIIQITYGHFIPTMQDEVV